MLKIKRLAKRIDRTTRENKKLDHNFSKTVNLLNNSRDFFLQTLHFDCKKRHLVVVQKEWTMIEKFIQKTGANFFVQQLRLSLAQI